MAMPTASHQLTPSPQVVGSAFVDQYYHILHASPELVHRFYQDSSVIIRPNASGTMTSATTMRAINELILSLDYNNYKAEIKSADAQESFRGGVMVLVTGCLTGKDGTQRKFAQSFFLAPQDKGYFVFNDVFRYVIENESVQTNTGITNQSVESAESANVIREPEPTPVSEHPISEPAIAVEEILDKGEEVCNPSDNEEGSVVDVEVVAESPAPSSQNEVRPITETASSAAQEDAPKKSYASILKVTKGERRPIPIYVPTNKARVTSRKTEQQSVGSETPAPEHEALAPSTEINDTHEEVEGQSIYIRSLPMNASPEQVEEEFKKFGRIKPGGIQVRSNKQQGYCFGFVEFEELTSMQSAIEASPVSIGGIQAFIEQKRTTSRGGGGKSRFPPNRGGFRNDNARARGNFGGGRGYGRNNFGNRSEFSGRGQGPSGRGGEGGYQRVNQSGGKAGRQGGANQPNNT
ncbi:ras GTPase-activating protein-binding protein 2-like [Thalictrum thalictroides]|uniref:Ras GTPase-activating protein-binding protein 2-like n=1 Tax=Thalictrum thalictroides TaxID=46969 RepID=A0A7J6WC98_THATH|nr:ras GTPase-activating protein-binding protein 2-like [Thalictrum thalictroides]